MGKQPDKFRLNRIPAPAHANWGTFPGATHPYSLLALEALCASSATSPIFPGALCVHLASSLSLRSWFSPLRLPLRVASPAPVILSARPAAVQQPARPLLQAAARLPVAKLPREAEVPQAGKQHREVRVALVAAQVGEGQQQADPCQVERAPVGVQTAAPAARHPAAVRDRTWTKWVR
jgi:hypothetical protein